VPLDRPASDAAVHQPPVVLDPVASALLLGDDDAVVADEPPLLEVVAVGVDLLLLPHALRAMMPTMANAVAKRTGRIAEPSWVVT
jgi:hypothetical protein